MKAKVKVKLCGDSFERWLNIKLKMEDEKFYWHRQTVVDGRLYGEGGKFRCFKSKDEFYEDMFNYLSNKDNIIKDGEELMREVIQDRAEELKTNSKEKEAKELLKMLNKPIEIEVKI